MKNVFYALFAVKLLEKDLNISSFTLFNNRWYCKQCYIKKVINNCDYCKEPILENCLKIKDKYYHKKHLFCNGCSINLKKISYEYNNYILCEKCYFKHINLKCYQCYNSIEQNYLKINGLYFHTDCFFCSYCNLKIKDGKYVEYKYLFFHLNCFNNNKICIKCKKKINEKNLIYLVKERNFLHSKCFKK